MGLDSASFYASLFLHCYEGRSTRQLRESDVSLAGRFAVYRFINNLTEFERSCKGIYPPNFEPKNHKKIMFRFMIK